MALPILNEWTKIHLMIDEHGILVIGDRNPAAEQAALRLERSINKGRFVSVYTLPYKPVNSDDIAFARTE